MSQNPATEGPADGGSPTPPGGQNLGGCLGCLGIAALIGISLAVSSIQSCTAQTSRLPVTSTVVSSSSDTAAGSGRVESTATITKGKLFSSGVVDILNAFDEGGHQVKLTICRDVSRVLDGMSTSAMQTGLDSMSDYDASVLQDLAADCNRLA